MFQKASFHWNCLNDEYVFNMTSDKLSFITVFNRPLQVHIFQHCLLIYAFQRKKSCGGRGFGKTKNM